MRRYESSHNPKRRLESSGEDQTFWHAPSRPRPGPSRGSSRCDEAPLDKAAVRPHAPTRSRPWLYGFAISTKSLSATESPLGYEGSDSSAFRRCPSLCGHSRSHLLHAPGAASAAMFYTSPPRPRRQPRSPLPLENSVQASLPQQERPLIQAIAKPFNLY